MTEVQFDPKEGKLWATIEMKGLYRIYYRFTLWSMVQNKPVILTEPPFVNNNITPHDDFLQVRNDFAPNEPVAKHDGREIFVEYNLVNTGDDNGYNLDVIISQGKTYKTSVEIGRDHLEGDMGGNNSKDEYSVIKLKKV
jgi:hypothetical protein